MSEISALSVSYFFFKFTAATKIYTLSLHDALPISRSDRRSCSGPGRGTFPRRTCSSRSEEHTSELQSRQYLVCRLLLEKKKQRFVRGKGWRSCYEQKCRQLC